jgi:hypothetical protein
MAYVYTAEQWTLPKKRSANEYKKLSDREVGLLESIVRDAFEGFDDRFRD